MFAWGGLWEGEGEGGGLELLVRESRWWEWRVGSGREGLCERRWGEGGGVRVCWSCGRDLFSSL